MVILELTIKSFYLGLDTSLPHKPIPSLRGMKFESPSSKYHAYPGIFPATVAGGAVLDIPVMHRPTWRLDLAWDDIV
jgi:hypothetical protein